MLNKYHITFLFFLVCFLASASLKAQEDDREIIIQARIWTPEGDTSYCHLLYINHYNLQFNLTIVDTSGKAQAYYAPKDLGGFSYSIDQETVVFMSLPTPDDMGRIFLRVVYQGRIQLFQYLEINYASTMLSFLVSYYLWEGKWLYPPLTQKFEQESLLYHFSDCPELEYKIKTGKYRLMHIKEIMSEYENCELTDEYEYFFE